MPWLGPVTILPARLLKGTMCISIISSPDFVGILPGGAGEPGPGLGCSIAPFMCMEFVLFELYKVSFAQHRNGFFFFLSFFFFNLKVSRGEPLSPAPTFYPSATASGNSHYPPSCAEGASGGQVPIAPAWRFACLFCSPLAALCLLVLHSLCPALQRAL